MKHEAIDIEVFEIAIDLETTWIMEHFMMKISNDLETSYAISENLNVLKTRITVLTQIRSHFRPSYLINSNLPQLYLPLSTALLTLYT